MREEFTPHEQRSLQAVPQVAAAAAVVVGVAVMAGWILAVRILTSFIPGQPPMRPLWALTFILGGLSLWLLCAEARLEGRRRLWHLAGRLCALGVVAIGFWTLVEYLLGWYPGINGLIVRDLMPGAKEVQPAAVAPVGSLAFIFAGGGLLTLDWKTRQGHHPTEFLAFAAILEGMVGVLDFLLHPSIFTSGVSAISSLLFVALGVALLVARPQHRFRMLLACPGLGGRAFRRLFPAAITVPVVLGWLMWRGQRAGLYAPDLGVTLTVVMSIAVLVVIVFWTTDPLDRADHERARAQEALRRSERSLAEAQRIAHVGNWEWDIVGNELRWSDEIYRIFGLTPQAFGATYEAFLEAVHPDDRKSVQRAVDEALAGREPYSAEHRIILPDGRIRIVHERGEVSFDAAGKPVRMLGTVQDITERQQAEEALRRASVYNRNLIETTLDPLVTIAPDGKITDVNLATEKATGLSGAELIGSDFSNYFTDPEKARAGYQRVFREGQVQDYELEIRHTDGHVTPVLYNASVYQDEAGEVVGVFAAARDITERRQAEQLIHVRARQQAVVAELGQRALAGINLQALMDEAVVSVAETLGVEYSKVLELLPDGQALLLRSGVGWKEGLVGHGTVGAGRDSQAGFTLLLGEPVVVEDLRTERRFHGPPLLHEHGVVSGLSVTISGRARPYGVLGAHTIHRRKFTQDDVHFFQAVANVLAAAIQRKQAEAEVSQASAYNRSLIEASMDPLVTISPDGKVTDVNSATEKVTGLSRQELVGTDFSNYFTEPEKARAGYQQVFREGRVQDYELGIRHRDGPVTPVVYNASLYRDGAGNVVGVFAAARDITERRRAEEEVRKLNEDLERRVRERTAELEAANKEMEAFTYSVSHDLRAPLRHIDGFSRLLQEEHGQLLPGEARHYLERIREGTRRMGQMVDDLLSLSRVGRRELRLQLTGLDSLLGEALRDLQPEIEGREIEWRLGTLPFVECDPDLTKEVLVNLLSNAVKFTRPRKPAVIEVGATTRAGTPAVFVRDNGVGFSMRYAGKLFGVFQRLHRQEDFEGTGVGLATVERIVHRHGGRVWAEGELNKGATFYFTLDSPEGQTDESHDAERRRMRSNEVEILLVEDNPEDVELTLHALQQEKLANYVEVARDGEEALDFLFCRGAYAHRSFEQPPYVVLLDLKLPKVDGLDVLREVKSDPRTQAIPVVILTASREEQDMVNGYHLGANGYIQKPVGFDEFRNIVKQLGLYWLVVNEPPPRSAFRAHSGSEGEHGR